MVALPAGVHTSLQAAAVPLYHLHCGGSVSLYAIKGQSLLDFTVVKCCTALAVVPDSAGAAALREQRSWTAPHL